MINPDGTKTCPRCSETKLAAGNFYKSGRKTGDGYTGYCIQCMKEKALEWQRALPADKRRKKDQQAWKKRRHDPAYTEYRRKYQRDYVQRNPEKQRAWQLAYKKRNPERTRHMNAIHNNSVRARKLGVPDGFQYADWVVALEEFKHACAYCGADACSLDVDHLDSMSTGGGNVPGNVVPSCRTCNANKGAKSLEDFAVERGFDPMLLRLRATIPTKELFA